MADDYLCYDITSVSSCSELNEFVRYGYNRDGEQLPQINLAMLFGQKSGLPVYYHRTPGNINDVSTLHNLVETFKALEVGRMHYVMDKGFYSLTPLPLGNPPVLSAPVLQRRQPSQDDRQLQRVAAGVPGRA
jgi:transposase